MSRKIKRKWRVSPTAAKTVDDLNFTARDAAGRILWWDVTPPKTDYYHVHEMLGRAYAVELLDLIHSQEISKHTLCFIVSDMVRKQTHGGLRDGFIGAISEFLITGNVDR